MNIKAKIYDYKTKELVNEFIVIENDSRRNFEKLEEYIGNNEDCRYSIDLLKDYGFNYFKNGISTKGLEVFYTYNEFGIEYIIKFEEC